MLEVLRNVRPRIARVLKRDLQGWQVPKHMPTPYVTRIYFGPTYKFLKGLKLLALWRQLPIIGSLLRHMLHNGFPARLPMAFGLTRRQISRRLPYVFPRGL